MSLKRVNKADIDEDFIKSCVSNETTIKQECTPKADTTVEKISKKRKDEEYVSTYLQRYELKSRQCVYISTDVHKKIVEITKSIVGKGMSVGAYIDNVLNQHLINNKDVINELYRKEKGDLL